MEKVPPLRIPGEKKDDDVKSEKYNGDFNQYQPTQKNIQNPVKSLTVLI